jgi:hypothetical protein
MKAAWLTLVMAAVLVAPAAADRADDDLAAVRKAVGGGGTPASKERAQAQPAEREAPRPAERKVVAEDEGQARPSPRPRGGEPRWLRVRIVEKGNKHGRVAVNLPLAVVRAFGDDWPIRGCHRCENGRGPTIGEVLRALDSGQSLVEVDDDEATVRIWVD